MTDSSHSDLEEAIHETSNAIRTSRSRRDRLQRQRVALDEWQTALQGALTTFKATNASAGCPQDESKRPQNQHPQHLGRTQQGASTQVASELRSSHVAVEVETSAGNSGELELQGVGSLVEGQGECKGGGDGDPGMESEAQEQLPVPALHGAWDRCAPDQL